MASDEYYQILGLADGASMQEIKDAYRRLALKYHPDKNGSKKDIEKFKQVTEAYRVLRTGPVIHSSGHKSRYSGTQSQSKVPYMYRTLEKILNEWVWPPNYTGKATQSIHRYAESLRFLEGVVLRSSSLLCFLQSECRQVQFFQSMCENKYMLKKGFRAIESKIQFW